MTNPLRFYKSISKTFPVCVFGNDISKDDAALIGLDVTKQISLQSWQKYVSSTYNGYTIIQMAEFPGKGNRAEHYRQTGAAVWNFLKEQNFEGIQLLSEGKADVAAFAEGLWLRNYRFENYKSKKAEYALNEIHVSQLSLNKQEVHEIWAGWQGIMVARDLVNEPANVLTAIEFSERIAEAGVKFGFDTEILGKARIQALKMGGLLSVNKGSTKPPTFTVIEYKSKKARNKKPIVLVGKGIVYDTGGLSLKPTPNSMDIMKCDMAGAAAVVGLFCAAAEAKLPIHLIGLIPATDNQVGPDAYAPGDVITMYDGSTVEVMNTDAEGRLVLADALTYAKKYNPELVIDLATLTGSALNALGYCAAAIMGTADEKEIDKLLKAGFNSWERLVSLPLWDDYASGLESDIADVKNLAAAPQAGVIVAGKFLERFTDFPWVHIDIAGPAFLAAAHGYLPKGGTGFGVNLLYNYFKERTNDK